MENVNKQLLDALIGARAELHRCQAVIHLAGGFDPAYVSCAKVAICKADEAIAAAEQAQQAEPVAWQPGNRPPSVFKTSEAGRQFVAGYFSSTLRRHDFSSYIKGHLAADFACALADGLHAMRAAQPQAVPDAMRSVANVAMETVGRSHRVVLHVETLDEMYELSKAVRAMLAAAPQAAVAAQLPPYDTFSNDDGDSWQDCPGDAKFVEGRKLGEEFELLAGWHAERVTFRVTKVPDNENDDYEVEEVTTPAAAQKGGA